ncbi:MAG: acyl-CoA dehydrogenase [Candidatus Syntrophoarchaeum caldarius]|uniref:Acyl-CoA dehydrogenase n=1 Tax=Candidatus Syntropharchaeum caldarium TaxID=1838285 RepID=A0A1F2P7C1_9EURY|nr:MAG: acyl-CoA dehydrogenase [Candidatus Syntrophoarchaeum caldarius]
MDFILSEEQQDIANAAREFAQGEFDKDFATECDQEHKFPRELIKKAGQLGFIGVHYEEEYGGAGLGAFENALIVEEMCRVDSTLGVCIALADFGSELIKWCGTEEQKKKYLPKVCSGESLSAGIFTEPDHGSDITEMSTTAVKDGDEWVINGTKTFITNGEIADFGVILVQTDPDAKPKYRGMSTILVEKDCWEAADVGSKMGIRSTSTAELSFSDARVPLENLVGVENRGFYQVLEFFDESRIEIAAQALGTAEAAYDRVMDYIKQRELHGRKLGSFQITQHKIADMATKIEASKLLVYKAALNYDLERKIDPVLTSMAKWFAARTAVEVADEAIQLFGGYGYINEYEVERIYRDAKICEIYEGTREVQKNTIASGLIGKL